MKISKHYHSAFYWLGLAFLLTTAGQFVNAQNQDAPSRQERNGRELASLLRSESIAIRDKPVTAPESSQTVVLRLASDGQLRSDGQRPKPDSITMTARRPGGSTMSRQRSLEYSSGQILVLSVDRAREVVWWQLVADPRILRAETADDSGNLHGETLFNGEAEFMVTCPAGDTVSELRLYQPEWDGRSFELKFIGSVALNAGGPEVEK